MKFLPCTIEYEETEVPSISTNSGKNTEKQLPKRAKLRIATAEPRFAKSRTERPLPKRERPITVRPDPSVPKLRSESELPRCRKSRTAIMLPKRATPSVERELANLAARTESAAQGAQAGEEGSHG